MNAGSAIFRAIADFGQVRRESRLTSRDLDVLGQSGNRNVRIFTGVARIFGAMGGGVGGLARGLAIILPVLGSMGAVLLSTTGFALGLVGALAPLAGLAPLMPGIWAGAAVGVLAFALAMKDVKKELGDLLPALQGVQKSTSAAFWSAARGPIHELADALLPSVTAGMGKVGGALGGLTSDFAGALKVFLGGNILPAMFNNTALGIENARAGAGPLANAISTIGSIGARYLPAIGKFAADMTIKLNDFIQLSDDQGKFEQWAAGGMTVLRELGVVVGSVFSIFKSLIQAAQNASTTGALTAMAGALAMFADILKRPEVQSGLTNVFAGANQAMGSIMKGVGALGGALGALGPALYSIMVTGGEILGTVLGFVAGILSTPGVGAGIITFMEGLQRGVDALMPALGPIGDLIAALLPLLASVAETFGVVLGDALMFVAPLLKDIALTLTPIVPLLMALGAAIAVVVFALNLSWIGLIVIAIFALVAAISFLVQHWDEVVNTVTVIWGGFLNWCRQVIDGFVVWWNTVWAGFGAWLGTVWSGMVAGVTGIWTGFVAWLTGIVNGIAVWWNGVWTGILAVVGVIVSGAVALFQMWLVTIQTVMTSIWTTISTVWNTVMGFIGAVLGAILGIYVSIWTQIFAFIGSVLQQIWAVIVSVWTAVSGFIVSVLGGIWAQVAAVWAQITAAVAAALNAIWGTVVSVWNTVLGFIAGVLNAIWSTIVSVWNSVVGAVAGALNSIWATIVGAWNNILGYVGGVMGSLWSTITGKWNEIVSWMGGIGGRIVAAVGNLGNLLVGAGRSVIQGLIDGLNAMWSQVSGFFSKLTSIIPSWKGPARRDKGLLKGAGRLIMGGFKGALESQYGGIRKSLQGFTADLNKGAEVGLSGSFGAGNAMRLNRAPGPAFAHGSTATTTVAERRQAGNVSLTVNNPKPERTTDSLPRAVRKLGYVGVGSNA